MAAELPELVLPDAAAWRAWLEQHHADSPGAKLVLGKKGGTVTTLTYDGALEEALCFGWIDGQVTRRDEESFFQRFTPRRPDSTWSKRNVDRVAQLEAAGRMHDAGRVAVANAKADGRWERAYAGPSEAVLPQDLLDAIAAVPEAAAMLEALTSQNRYAFYFRLSKLSPGPAREKRIAAFVEQLARHELPYPQKRQPGD
jgi:uncharacterized protein YdeI (YjbR/CyaY-like superfamily)